MNKEIKRIDAKVQAQLKMLDQHCANRDAYYANCLREEQARQRPRLTYITAIEDSFSKSKMITDAARELMLITTKWNLIKAKLDESSADSDNPNDIAFEQALAELISIKPTELFEAISMVKRIRRWRKLESPIRNDLLSQYEFMKRVYKYAPKHLKRMRMSEAQRNAADRASARMKMRWCGF